MPLRDVGRTAQGADPHRPAMPRHRPERSARPPVFPLPLPCPTLAAGALSSISISRPSLPGHAASRSARIEIRRGGRVLCGGFCVRVRAPSVDCHCHCNPHGPRLAGPPLPRCVSVSALRCAGCLCAVRLLTQVAISLRLIDAVLRGEGRCVCVCLREWRPRVYKAGSEGDELCGGASFVFVHYTSAVTTQLRTHLLTQL